MVEYAMPLYCADCDEFFNYTLAKKLNQTKRCPKCGKEYYAYYRTKAMALKYAPVKARCMDCELLGKAQCPKDGQQIDPFYTKPCNQFVPKG
jgi:predicted  nucleic acid-binding Zn-ribbon protein